MKLTFLFTFIVLVFCNTPSMLVGMKRGPEERPASVELRSIVDGASTPDGQQPDAKKQRLLFSPSLLPQTPVGSASVVTPEQQKRNVLCAKIGMAITSGGVYEVSTHLRDLTAEAPLDDVHARATFEQALRTRLPDMMAAVYDFCPDGFKKASTLNELLAQYTSGKMYNIPAETFLTKKLRQVILQKNK